MSNRTINLVGRRFDRLQVLRDSGNRQNGKIMWLCKCDCGGLTQVRGTHLTGGKILSCGCYAQESKIARAAEGSGVVRKTHGASTDRLYFVYRTMLQRCSNPNNDKHAEYGARGISVCSRWQGEGGFERFVSDMGDPPTEQHTIDRKDNDGDYEPSNCRWATPSEQARNRRYNCKVVWLEREWPLIDLAEGLEIPYKVLHARHISRGWSLQRAIEQPLRRSPHKV